MFNNHTFAICAYKESEYLEKCIRSIVGQSVKSNVIICTSTPNEYIRSLARKYKLKTYIRKGEPNIKEDWNFAYDKAKTPYVTLAHQDDLYNKDYTKELKKSIKKSKGDFLIYYTGYRPVKNNEIKTDINCILRAVLRFPMNFKLMSGINAVKLATLSLGNSICCPSVTYNKKKIGRSVFTSELKFNIDWDTFYKLANTYGRFLYNNKILTYYRIHNAATSKAFIDNNLRVKEDTKMFEKFFSPFITKIIMRFYRKAYKTYEN